VRAVTVPAGTHRVTFTYRTPLLVLGAWLSLAGALLCAGLIGYALTRPSTSRSVNDAASSM
jgi:uncharacterized membrane protein YfhO